MRLTPRGRQVFSTRAGNKLFYLMVRTDRQRLSTSVPLDRACHCVHRLKDSDFHCGPTCSHQLGGKETLAPSYGTISDRIGLVCDGEELVLPPGLKGVVVLNITSFSGVRGPKPPIRDTTCCCHPLTGVPYLCLGPRRAPTSGGARSSVRPKRSSG